MEFIKSYRKLYSFLFFLFLVPAICQATNDEKFKLVQNTAELKDGDVVIVVKKDEEKGNGVALSTEVVHTSNNTLHRIASTPVSITDDTAIATVNVEYFQLEANEENGSEFFLKALSKDKYLCNGNTYTSNNKNYKNSISYSEKSQKQFFICSAKVNITIDKNCNAKILYQGNSTHKLFKSCLCFYGNLEGELGRFSCYQDSFLNSPDRRVQLYKKVNTSVSLSESADNSENITANIGKSADVSLTRTLVADKWNTFCVPFDINISDGKIAGVEARVLEFESVEGNIICFANVADGKIKAGQPYLINPQAQNIVNPSFKNVTLSVENPGNKESNGYQFCGVYSQKTFEAEESNKSLIINGEANFKRPKANTTMKGMRAYFACPSAEAAASQLRIDGETTSISEIIADTDEAGNIYNINGVCVGHDANTLPRGLYIKNGKKMMLGK